MHAQLSQTKISRYTISELQIRKGFEVNSKIFFLFLNENIFCDPSFEPSRRDGSNDGSQNMFQIPFLTGALCLHKFYGKFYKMTKIN